MVAMLLTTDFTTKPLMLSNTGVIVVVQDCQKLQYIDSLHYVTRPDPGRRLS